MYLPYVYIMTNRISGKFYIGMRSANKDIAEKDLGKYYFTSSKTVKNAFDEFDPFIVAYFIDQQSAFEFENLLIQEHWENPLLLNKHYQRSMSSFSMKGVKRPDLSEYNKSKQKPKEERKYICTTCKTLFTKIEFAHHPQKMKPFCSLSCSGKFAGAENGSKRKGIPNLKNFGKTAWNRGKENPFAKENAIRGAEKNRNAALGRRMAIREDGTRYWIKKVED